MGHYWEASPPEPGSLHRASFKMWPQKPPQKTQRTLEMKYGCEMFFVLDCFLICQGDDGGFRQCQHYRRCPPPHNGGSLLGSLMIISTSGKLVGFFVIGFKSAPLLLLFLPLIIGGAAELMIYQPHRFKG